MRAFRKLRWPALLAMALSLAAPQVRSEIDLSTLAVAPNPRLGLSFPGSKLRYYPYIASTGLGVVRVSASWDRIEPSRGQFRFSGLDDRVRTLQELGIHPFITFESTADWATDPATRSVKNARPVDLADWSRFIATVVERYDADGRNDMPGLRRSVPYYQAANEWISSTNGSGGWAGSTQQLIDYVRAARDAVKGQDPNATFAMGGIAAFNSDVLLVALDNRDIEVRQSWGPGSETVFTHADINGPEITGIINNRVLPVLRNAPFDLASVHLYGPEGRDAARIALIRRLTGRSVLSSECGGPTLDYGGRYTPEDHFRAVIERNLNVFAAGARFCLWFRLGESNGASYGNRKTALFTRTAQAKPGVFAYKVLARLIDANAQVSAHGYGRYQIRRGSGEQIDVAWGNAVNSLGPSPERYCLENAREGLLSEDASACAAGAMTFAGAGLTNLLSPR